jgi:hypothetical protein
MGTVSGGGRYGRPAGSPDDDFGAGNGYAGAPGVPGGVPHGMNGPQGPGSASGPKTPGVYGGGAQVQAGSAQVGNTYGRPSGGADNTGYGEDFDNGYENYGSAGGDYGIDGGYDGSGYADGGYASSDEGYEDGPDQVSGDPNYKARRHRPSANDTNVGTLADFAAYGGYDRTSDRGADERYVQGYDPNGYGRW